MTDNLTEKQEMACRLYGLEGKTKSDAYRGAYNTVNMKPATINRKAKKLFDEGKIRARVNQLKEERCERLNYDADQLLKQLSGMLNADILDIYDTDIGSIKPLDEWPLIWRQRLDLLETQEIFTKGTDNKSVIGKIIKVKFIPVSKLLELVGKHVNVGAYSKTHKHDLVDNLTEKLTNAIRRRDD
ncbi:terminase small subunit [Kangiella sediminilitoris]|uniref:Terminase small subunit n=1 Tax=Kangiella sediminilitoris TaxID=1144748 RepID=A0A1B3B903_9GAMM|nr:terminase small subunit [Kangiella sediminilitoris]AOE49261.1 hypothetical protein KS2013_537 [Kangiella sediminilitoris]